MWWWFLFEFWGYWDMYGVVLVFSELFDVYLGVLFLYNEGYSFMCGYGVLVLGCFVFDFGLVFVLLVGVCEVCVNIYCLCGLVVVFV